MSRAFVKELDEGRPEELPERPVSVHPNFVTPAGLRLLEEEAEALQEQRLALLGEGDDPVAQQRLAHIDRDLRYVQARLSSARVVGGGAQPRDEVAFGAAVSVIQPDQTVRVFTIVGEDEADSKSGKISHVSPLAQALAGARVGDQVRWRRPAGDRTLVVKHIEYTPQCTSSGA